MKFVAMDELRPGARLARPVYNRKGVLLFERDTRLTAQAIESISKFGLLGSYILEPAEPLPPMSEEDLEFERFQIMMGFSIQDELERIIQTKKQSGIQNIVVMLVKKYGHLDGKMHFYQNLRSRDDFVSRHSLNVAILCTMMCHVLNMRLEEQQQTITAALVHDIGKLSLTGDVLFPAQISLETQDRVYRGQCEGMNLVEYAFADGGAVKRICNQALRVQHEFETGGDYSAIKMVQGARVLLVANCYDELTAMNLHGDSKSELSAIRYFMEHPEIYDKDVVDALVASIEILFAGVSVVLSTGEKALVLSENKENVLRPTVLCFGDNSILNLGLRVNQDIEIVDVMKSLDNRYVMEQDTTKKVTQ